MKYNTLLIGSIIYLICITPFAIGNCTYIFENKTTYSCSYSLAVTVQYGTELHILAEPSLSPGEKGVLKINIQNMRNVTYTIEYYTFATKGSQCVSCKEKRDENIQKTSIEPFSQKTLETDLIIEKSGTFDYKFMYREEGRKSWQEIKGTVTVTGGNPPNYQPFITSAKKKANMAYIFMILGGLLITGNFFISKKIK